MVGVWVSVGVGDQEVERPLGRHVGFERGVQHLRVQQIHIGLGKVSRVRLCAIVSVRAWVAGCRLGQGWRRRVIVGSRLSFVRVLGLRVRGTEGLRILVAGCRSQG